MIIRTKKELCKREHDMFTEYTSQFETYTARCRDKPPVLVTFFYMAYLGIVRYVSDKFILFKNNTHFLVHSLAVAS